jgi:endoglucanase Acf2
MKKVMKKSMAVALALVMATGQFGTDFSSKEVKGDTSATVTSQGSLADKVTGTWSYEADGKTVVQTNAMLLNKLPTLANKGTYRWTTDNYDNSTGVIDVGGWSTSMAWNYSSNEFGDSVYAIPLSYAANKNGMFVTKPSTVIVEDEKKYTSTVFMNQPEDGSLTDFLIGTGYTFSSSKVDKVTEWSTDVIMENASNKSQYMKTIMTQGSPFSFFELTGTTAMTVKRNRNLPSDVVYYNGSTVADSTMLVIRVYDNQDLVSGYGDYDYYAVYVPEGTVWTQADATASYADNRMGNLTANFPSESKAYMTLAYLCESTGYDDSLAQSIAEEYEKYAYNFITDTSTSFVYDRSNGTVTTTYSYSFDKKSESSADGTVMGILPHQYKYMSGYTYLSNTARTIRGTMKYLEGDSYKTVLTYSGILPSMPSVDTTEKATLQSYVTEFMDTYGPTDTELTKENYDENTYDTGKKLNRALQVMEAAEACGDTESAAKLLEAIERELADWYTASGTDTDKYFYYDKNVGSLFGFPQAYYTVDGMTDHHFHYGYFIQASAQVALRDPSFIQKYGNIVEELVGDIATYERTNENSKYPFLRYFSTYEGHSWASGHSNFADGNNQESSSEAINAWAALILWGQATDNQELTDLGVYLYQTEISAVNCYWFDVDEDVLTSSFKKTATSDSSVPKYACASMVWGGKYTYAAWWTAEPLQIQGINILPMTSASFYYAANKDFILKNWKTANLKEAEYRESDKDTSRWNEIWSSYLAIASPQKALEVFDDICSPEAGESKAHAYHYIMSLDKAGTPNLEVTSDDPLATTFINDDGELTYVAYNASTTTKTVEFSDGTTLTVESGKTTEKKEGDVTGKSNYKISYYLQNDNGGYTLFRNETKSAKTNSTVTVSPKAMSGYVFNSEAEGNVLTGTVTEDGSLVLKLYYDITEDNSSEDETEVDLSKYTKLGTYDDSDISYYIMRDDFGIANVQLLDNGQTFYVVYSGDFSSGNTTGYLNRQNQQGNVQLGVYKLSVPTLEKDSWNTVKAVSGSKQIYIVIKYGNPSGTPDLSDYEGEVETTDANAPTEPLSVLVGSVGNKINITFRSNEEQNEKGQTYNIYVDGKVVFSGVTAGTYTVTDVEKGRHTVKVTGALNGKESEGVSNTLSVTGETTDDTTKEPVTTKPAEITTTTVKPDDTTTKAESAETTTVKADDTTTKTESAETTTSAKTDETTVGTNQNETTADFVNETTKSSEVTTTPTNEKTTTTIKVARTKVKKASKKKTSKKAKISLKKIKGAAGYQIAVYKTKKNAKKNKKAILKKTVKKFKFTFKSKKIKNKKKLYIKARAYKFNSKGNKVYGKWSKVKKIKIK